LTITLTRDKKLWVSAIGRGLNWLNPTTNEWTHYSLKEREDASAKEIIKITQDIDDALWLGTTDDIIRFNPVTGAESRFSNVDGIPDTSVSGILQDADNSVWIGMGEAVTRLVLGGPSGEAGTIVSTHQLRPYRLTTLPGSVVISRPGGLSFVDVKDNRAPHLTVLPTFPSDAQTTALAPGPSDTVWAGTAFSGLTLRVPERQLQLTRDGGLPSMTITALAPVPGAAGARVWVGTSAGAALVGLEGESLRVERTARWEGMPTGPVDALAAAADGSVFVVYNALPPKRFLDPELAQRRAGTRAFHVPPEGPPREIPVGERLSKGTITTLAYSPKHGLWAGTSLGLFVARAEAAGSVEASAGGFEPVSGQNRLPPMPIRQLAVAPDTEQTLWMAVDRQGDTPALVVGYRPGTEWVYTLTPELGVPRTDSIDDMAFTDDGHLVVMAGPQLASGRVFVPVAAPSSRWPLVLPFGLVLALAIGASAWIQRRQLYLRTPLPELPLDGLHTSLSAMRRYRVLDEGWSRLGLPPSRVPLVEALASPATTSDRRLRALAELLGMEGAASAPARMLPDGLTLLVASLPYPPPLRGHPISLVAIDAIAARKAEPGRVRHALQAALEEAGQRFELPFVLLARGDVADDILPADLGSLRLGERELKALLFARDPERTFAGLLHARRLLGLSPYTTAGEVKDERMFFGRVGLLKELLLAPVVQHILVGPRRVGKTSLLKRLLRELPARRPEVDPVFLDLLGVADHARAARALARELGVTLPATAPPEVAFAEILRAHFQQTAIAPAPAEPAPDVPYRTSWGEAPPGAPPNEAIRRHGVVLIDEADGLVEADAARGFPLLAALRALQAEGVCSFVLAGYQYLYREALNQRSPLYNFAITRLLGPIEPEAARDLALVPMQRLGITYTDPDLPARIAARTGGYPGFIQLLCDAALGVLREVGSGDLALSPEHIAQAEERVATDLRDIFLMNVGQKAQLVAYLLLDRNDFSAADAQEQLTRTLGRPLPIETAEQALLELRLFGFVVKEHDRFSWSIPLLCDSLRLGDRTRAAGELLEELAQRA
jgi:hypothetical protein